MANANAYRNPFPPPPSAQTNKAQPPLPPGAPRYQKQNVYPGELDGLLVIKYANFTLQ